MRLVNPVGRERIEIIADFEITPYGGCACSIDYNTGNTNNAVAKAQVPDKPCGCACAYGDENQAANFQIGYK